MKYEWNYQAETIARRVIDEWHPHLRNVQIAYLSKSSPANEDAKPKKAKPQRDGKKTVWAKASLVSDKTRALGSQHQFCIEFDLEVWNQLTLKQHEALVDHELLHCGRDIDGYYMRSHDIEEFRQIVTRHGFWKDDVRLFSEAIQETLFEMTAK